jgi:putative RNA ligase
MKVNLDELTARVERRLISLQKHPTEELYIYNYTPLVQFSRSWDEYILMCRGLILDGSGTVVARPFRKFFNLEEHVGTLPSEPFLVTEKLDGSLGILYPVCGGYAIATRGSFTSDQALKGTQMFREYVAAHGTDWIRPEYTYLFEIIYPANRIVVDYGDAERLVLLAAIHTETGGELDHLTVEYLDKARLFDSPAALEQLRATPVENAEGYVVRFQSGLRIKMKFAEYVRLHRLLTQVSTKSIWELLRNGQPFEDLAENVPDEFYAWVRATAGQLLASHAGLMLQAQQVIDEVKGLPTRRDMAGALANREPTVRAMAFALLDGKVDRATEVAWKALKPAYERPFKQDIDA